MWYIIIISSLIEMVQGANWTATVSTTKGLIRGMFAEDGDYSMYLGIPYAKVDPLNPFGISTPQPNFEDVFYAIDDTAICPQLGFRNTSIDCLHLNIYVPNANLSKIPVLVWIYGGGFASGFASRISYGPKYLVRHNIILVSLNYRVGPYGFMCLDTEEVPGNQGLRDQYLALKWINENIPSFGGDVDKVTVMGESAGSMSIDLHLMSDLPKYYNQAILQSGTGLTPTVVIASDNTVPVRIATYLGYTTNKMTDALSFLASAQIDSVLSASFILEIPFRLCVEKEFRSVERFISVHPELTNISHVNNMSIMAGFTSHEQLALFIDTPTEQMVSLFHDHIIQQYDIDEFDSMINIVKRFYIGDNNISEEISRELIDFKSDFVYNYPTQRSIDRYLENGAKVYQFMFSYDGDRNYLKKKLNLENEGAAHTDDLGYLFDIEFLWKPPSFEDKLIINRMTTMWTNFVKYGNPTPTTSELIPVTWTPASREVITYMDINSNLTVSTRPYHNRMSFWDLFLIANRNKLRTSIIQPSSSPRFSSVVVCQFFMTTVIYLLS